MTLIEQFEKYSNEIRPCMPYSASEYPEQWVSILEWQERYTEWLEAKLQNTSSNNDYAKCPKCSIIAGKEVYGVYFEK